MFMVTEAEAAAIRTIHRERGEWAAVMELRGIYPAITDNTAALQAVRRIVGWIPSGSGTPARPG